jgi:hypothetical protein
MGVDRLLRHSPSLHGTGDLPRVGSPTGEASRPPREVRLRVILSERTSGASGVGPCEGEACGIAITCPPTSHPARMSVSIRISHHSSMPDGRPSDSRQTAPGLTSADRKDRCVLRNASPGSRPGRGLSRLFRSRGLARFPGRGAETGGIRPSGDDRGPPMMIPDRGGMLPFRLTSCVANRHQCPGGRVGPAPRVRSFLMRAHPARRSLRRIGRIGEGWPPGSLQERSREGKVRERGGEGPGDVRIERVDLASHGGPSDRNGEIPQVQHPGDPG